MFSLLGRCTLLTLFSKTFVAFFGVCAAIGSIRAGWKATALPPTLPTREATEQGATVQVEVLAPLDQAADFSEDLATAPLTTDGFPNNVSRS